MLSPRASAGDLPGLTPRVNRKHICHDIIAALAEDHPSALHIAGLARRIDEPKTARVRYQVRDMERRGLLALKHLPGQGNKYYHLTDLGLLVSTLPRVSSFSFGETRGANIYLTPQVVQILRLFHSEQSPEGLTTSRIFEGTRLPEPLVRNLISRLLRTGALVSGPRIPGPGHTSFVLYRLTDPGAELAEQCSHPGLPLELFETG